MSLIINPYALGGVETLTAPSIYFVDGGTGEAFLCTDGATFVSKGRPPGLPTDSGLGRIIQMSSGVYVAAPNKAVASGGTVPGIYYTTNPLAGWTFKSLGFGIRDIATDGTTVVAVGETGNIQYATDPAGTWTAWTSGVGAFPIFAVCMGDGKTVIAGYSSATAGIIRVATSVGGAFTTRSPTMTSHGGTALYYDGANFYCGCSNGNMYWRAKASAATTNWTLISASTTDTGFTTQINDYFDPPTNDMAAVGSSGRFAKTGSPVGGGLWTSQTITSAGSNNMFAVAYVAAWSKYYAGGTGRLSYSNNSNVTTGWTSMAPAGFTQCQGFLVTV